MCGDEETLAPRKEMVMKQLGYESKPPCKPNLESSPEVVILYEDHTIQEQGGAATAKRGLLANITGTDDSMIMLTEMLSDNATPVAQARVLVYFKLPVNKRNLNASGTPTQSDARLKGLDNDQVIAVRTLQIALQDIELKYVGKSMQGKLNTEINREAFFEFAVGNQHLRKLLEKLSFYYPKDEAAKSTAKIFGEKPRVPLDNSISTIWTDPRYAQYRTNISSLATAFLQNVGTVELGVSTFGNKSLWRTDFKSVAKGGFENARTDKYDDTAFYFLLRTLYSMAINAVPVITTPETAGGLLRDWVFVRNIQSAICEQSQKDRKVKKIIVSVGSAHATRIADLLRKDGFVTDKNLRFLNSSAFQAGTIVSAINSNLTHQEKLIEKGYKEECNYFRPSLKTDGKTRDNNQKTNSVK